MILAKTAFELVEQGGVTGAGSSEEPRKEYTGRPAPQPKDNTAAIQTLMLLLKTLGQRFVVALSNLRTLLSAGAVFWMFMSIPAPGTYHLIAEAMFSLFVLAVNWIWRSKNAVD